ncbi:MAG: repeat family protein [Clostridia bacterium]|jgi:Tfp pilus assembly protein PilE|nr:repeat family protein [Clostridia bacterium]
MKNTRRGISLIVLVITIIIIAILAGGVILTLSTNNPINSANEAAFKSDLDAIASDLNMYQTSQYAKAKTYSPNKLDANDLSAEYDGVVIEGKTIKDIIPILSKTDKYNGQFEITDGKLVYLGTNRTQKRWAQDVNVEVIDADRLDAIISTATALPISAGTEVVAIIKISSNASINNINITNNLELLDHNNLPLTIQPVFEIGVPSGTDLDALRTVEVTIKTDGLAEGIYKLKLKSYSISNIYDVTNSKDIVSSNLFEIDNTPPTNPEMSATPTAWTNSDVTVSITYPPDSVTKEYSLDGTSWDVYTNSITVSTNNETIYARAIDIAGNQSGQSTITVANIDRELPTVTFGTNGGNNLQVASTKVILTDIGVSGLDVVSFKYIWDTQNVDEPTGQWNTFVNDEVINKVDSNGTYYLWIKALDNAGNSLITKSNVFTVDNIVPENPTMSANPTTWTNGNVTVTITYSDDTAIKEYSTNGTTWSAYTAPVVVSTNNTTVYARASDASGNQSGQSTITIANIDKVIPTVAYATNGGTNLQTASTVVTANDLGGSNIASLEYIWDTQNATTPSSGWTAFTTGSTITKSSINGTYYLWIRVIDNAENNFVTKSNAFVADNTPPVNPTMSASPTGFTNGNVTVTIIYPSDAAIKEYSTNGTAWSAYTVPVVVTTNNTTIYARGSDVIGNQSGQSTITIANIDKEIPVISETFSGGAIYDDPTFSNGYNNTNIYNNLGNGLVTNTRTVISDSPVGSQYGLVIKSTGAVVPGYGGFYFATQTVANKVFVTKIIAKIPVGYNINWASNAIGTEGAATYWLTSQAGTGNWQEYIFEVRCGSTGPFSTTNFYYLTGETAPTVSSPLVWTVAYANVFDKDKWSTSDSVMFNSTDNKGIVAYGINQSSTIQPTFTNCSSTTNITKLIDNITVNGTYYVWVKDQAGNVVNKAITISNVDTLAPQISTDVRSVLNTTFSNWTLSGGAYIDGSGQLVLPNTGSRADSPYLQVDGNPWIHELDATTSQSSPYFTPAGGVLIGSSYFDSSYNTAVSNNTYSGNGYAEKILINGTAHARWDGWSGYGPNVKYVKVLVTVDAYYSNAPVTCYNVIFTSSNVTSPSKKVIVTVTDDISGIKTKKWLSGSKTVNDFQSAGTIFDTEFTVTVNGTYTIYTEDNAGNKTVRQVIITQIG